jgi:hypothetical protein
MQVVAAVLCIPGCLNSEKNKATSVRLASLKPVFAIQPSSSMQIDRTSGGKSLQIGDRRFSFGISVSDTSEVTYILNGRYSRFDAWAGVDANELPHNTRTAIFQVFGDGNRLFDSGPMNADTAARNIGLDVSNIRELQLTVVNGGDGKVSHADWAQPTLTPVKLFGPDKSSELAYEISGGGLTLRLDTNGEIVGLKIGKDGREVPFSGGTRLVQCGQMHPSQVQRLPDGAVLVTRIVEDSNGNACSISDRFSPTADSIRWDVDIYGEGKPWSTSIITGLRWPVTKNTKYWTTWSDPDMTARGWREPSIDRPPWHDPLEARAFADTARWYGGNPIVIEPPISGDSFSVPLLSILEPDCGTGFSFIHSPEDSVFQMRLVTAADGHIEFQHRYHRLGAGNHVRFSMDLVGHAADWRGGLAWMSKRYADYFEPAVAKAYEVQGCGAYSAWEGDLDADKLKKMAFSFNWKASFDFPYMGMFLPPVDEWPAFGSSEIARRWAPPQYLPRSKQQLNDYSRRMRQYGFHVLNYFSATEFGAMVKNAADVNWGTPEEDVWKNCTDFLYRKIADGVLYNEKGDYYRTWGLAVVMDCGARDYQKFLLEQAQSHIDTLPESSGICIDRMDWLRLFNTRADDGISWYNNKPARSLLVSWTQFMDKLGPMMHKNDKVIFLNPLGSMRLDMMHHGDGIYSEHNETGPALNASALLGIFKPIIAWTTSQKSLEPSPDVFFQRLLYLGVFPTAPLPANDHTIRPSEFADRWYLAYGPLFNQLKGRQWVLDTDVLRVQDNAAKANIFEVPGGYAIPVVLADPNTRQATIQLSSQGRFSAAGNYKFEVLQPGVETPITIEPSSTRDSLKLQVPLHSGCAMVRMTVNPHIYPDGQPRHLDRRQRNL